MFSVSEPVQMCKDKGFEEEKIVVDLVTYLNK